MSALLRRSRRAVVTLVSLGALASAPGRAERQSGGPHELRVPEQLVLGGPEASAEVVVGRPPDERYLLLASTGTLRPAGEPNRWRYLPPAQRHPQLVVIALVIPGQGHLEWVALPLIGRPTIQTRTTPGAQVWIEFGDQRVGPARADDTGRAELQLQVPPGVASVTTHVIDALGNERRTATPLNVPPLAPLLLWCAPQPARVLVVAADPSGQPRPAPAPSFAVQVEGGSLGPFQELGPGVHAAAYTPPPDAPIGRRLAATLAAAPGGPQLARCHFEVLANPAARLVLRLDEGPGAPGGGPREVLVIGTLLDAAGLPAQDLQLRYEAGAGCWPRRRPPGRAARCCAGPCRRILAGANSCGCGPGPPSGRSSTPR